MLMTMFSTSVRLSDSPTGRQPNPRRKRATKSPGVDIVDIVGSDPGDLASSATVMAPKMAE